MTGMEQIGPKFWRARFLLEIAHENLVLDDSGSDDEVEEKFADLGAALDEVKDVCNWLAGGSDDFCKGYLAANRKALADGQQWSEERAEKIALLRLAGDDTPEEQIPL